MKRYLQDEAMEYMGENKASEMAKQAIDKIPEGDQKVCNCSVAGATRNYFYFGLELI